MWGHGDGSWSYVGHSGNQMERKEANVEVTAIWHLLLRFSGAHCDLTLRSVGVWKRPCADLRLATIDEHLG